MPPRAASKRPCLAIFRGGPSLYNCRFDILRAVDAEMARRSVPFYTVAAPPQLSRALKRYGFKQVSPTPFTLLVKATQE